MRPIRSHGYAYSGINFYVCPFGDSGPQGVTRVWTPRKEACSPDSRLDLEQLDVVLDGRSIRFRPGEIRYPHVYWVQPRDYDVNPPRSGCSTSGQSFGIAVVGVIGKGFDDADGLKLLGQVPPDGHKERLAGRDVAAFFDSIEIRPGRIVGRFRHPDINGSQETEEVFDIDRFSWVLLVVVPLWDADCPLFNGRGEPLHHDGTSLSTASLRLFYYTWYRDGYALPKVWDDWGS